MPKQRTELGTLEDFEFKINNYFDNKPIWSKVGLMNWLELDKDYWNDYLRNDQKWKKDYLHIYKKALRKILEQKISLWTSTPQGAKEYIERALAKEFQEFEQSEVMINTENRQIVINFGVPRSDSEPV